MPSKMISEMPFLNLNGPENKFIGILNGYSDAMRMCLHQDGQLSIIFVDIESKGIIATPGM